MTLSGNTAAIESALLSVLYQLVAVGLSLLILVFQRFRLTLRTLVVLQHPEKPGNIPYRPSGRYAPTSSYHQPVGAPVYGSPYGNEVAYPPPPAPYGQQAYQMPAQQQVTQQLYIPNELVGSVIGKGGSKINEIRQQSGSQVRIHEADPKSTERLVSIIGTPESNQAALYLLYGRLQSERSRLASGQNPNN